MLIELRIRDFAVLDDVSIELRSGLNVLSGETGAGKSIVVGALSLLLGERASSDIVRAGADRAVVEGVFDVSEHSEVLARLEELGIEADEGLLILKREVAGEGRNRAWVNGSPATAGMVGQLGAALIDLHGQQEHQTLLKPVEQRRILDAFGGGQDLARSVAERHRRLKEVQARLESHESRVREIEGRSDFLRFQLDEIDQATLGSGEDRTLEDEARRLENSEELARDAQLLHDALYGGENALSDRLAELQRVARRIAELDPTLTPDADALDGVYHGVVELGRRVGDYAANVEHDPLRLEEVRSRLDLLSRLKRKYGPELADVMETAGRLRAELAELDNASVDLSELRREREVVTQGLSHAATALRILRQDVSARLAEQVGILLPELGMPGATFEVALVPLPEVGSGGTEAVEFRAALNSGFAPAALSRIASGGELSRVMLALKTVLAAVDHVPTLVFDEIDAGIGGVIAGKVGEKLRDLAARHQVFVVTHLPQLASRAHTHFLVKKDALADTAVTGVRELAGEARVAEIARMLGGDPESETSRDHARELLKTA